MCYIHKTHVVVSIIHWTSFPRSLIFEYLAAYSISKHIQSKRIVSHNRLPRQKMSYVLYIETMPNNHIFLKLIVATSRKFCHVE